MSDIKKTKKKILIYTDIGFFAGCDNVLENIVNFNKITEEFKVVYAYNYSKKYKDDLDTRCINVSREPVFLPNNRKIFQFIDTLIQHKSLRRLFKLPLILLERLHFYSIYDYVFLYLRVKKIAPDLVHINNGGYPGSISCRVMALAAKSAGVNTIVFTVNNIATPYLDIFDKILDICIIKLISKFTTASIAAANELARVRYIDTNKIMAIPNTVLFDKHNDCDINKIINEFSIAKDTLIIGSVGLLTKRKGYNVLIKALADLEIESNWIVLIFGEGEDRRELEEMISTYGLQDKVRLPGFRSDISSYISNFDVFILPSISNEDFPNVINEAMLLAKPIIGTRVAGIPEQIMHDKTGYLVEPGNSDELKNAILTFSGLTKNKRTEMGEASLDHYLRNFSYEKSMQKYYDIYKNYLTN